ncbi:MAG: hypothetical protein GY865_01740 [candidate division Zixibacteria bacterium]|nr:hypothetical protein [candidate division Zixibacteria bacterium]
MIKNIVTDIVLIFILATVINCGAESNEINREKDNIMALDTKDMEYPIQWANFQRNSLVPVEMKCKWKPLWSNIYLDVDEDFVESPDFVHINDENVGVRSRNNFFVYNISGKFKHRIPLSGTAGVVFGPRALAYLDPVQQLTYQDYEYNQIGNADVIPYLDQYSYEMLLKPSLDEVLAVVQFTGAPRKLPKKYYIYSFDRNENWVKWDHEFDGRVDFALLSNDEKSIIISAKNEISLFDVTSGEIKSSFKLDIDTPLSASLDKNDNLIIMAKITIDEKTTVSLKAITLDGKELWSFPIDKLSSLQPPACDNDGRIFINDGLQLLCIKEGEIDWTAILTPAERNYITITADNHAVVINGSLLALFAPDGEKLLERLITKTDDQFYAPPALDKDGHIFVAGKKALYCFE